MVENVRSKLQRFTVLFLIIWFSFTIMVIVHEAWHVFQFHRVGVREVCFIGYHAEPNRRIFGWVIPEKAAYYTEWDARFIGFGVALASSLILIEVFDGNKETTTKKYKTINIH